MYDNITIYVKDWGILPDSDRDYTLALHTVLQMVKHSVAPVTIAFEKGTYHLHATHALRMPYHITNTATQEENPDITKTIGLFCKDMQHVTIEGNGALLVYHGEMTTMVFDNCKHITIRNLSIDFARPTISELVVNKISANKKLLHLQVHPDSWYDIEDEKIIWYGENWRKHHTLVQEYDPTSNMTWRVEDFFKEAISITEIAKNRLCLRFAQPFEAIEGHIYQLREDIRTQVGVFITQSTDIHFLNVGFHYMHGLGIIAQYASDITIQHCNFKPRAQTGRTAAAFADFTHFVGCTGQVCVRDCFFCGSHDDIINIHGFYFNIIDRPSENQAIVQFMHPQSFGFDAFFIGDTVDFNDSQTLLLLGSRTVTDVLRLTDYTICLTFDGHTNLSDCVENASRYPSVMIENCVFTRCPTRGILLSTRKKSVIRNNLFQDLNMSAILVANDALHWYESGTVSDLLIANNTFINIGDPAILIYPENSVTDTAPVHTNIRIADNTFYRQAKIKVKSTGDLCITNNVTLDGSLTLDLEACSNVCTD